MRASVRWLIVVSVLAGASGCSREEWVLDTEATMLRSQVACAFDAQRSEPNAVQARLQAGQHFTVRRRELVEDHACWFIRTPDGLQGWMVFTLGRAHRIR